MIQNRNLGWDSEFKYRILMEQNPLKKTKLMSVKGTDVKLK